MSCGDYRFYIIPFTSKLLPILYQCLIVFFYTFNGELLARGISLYQLLSDRLHRPWSYSYQVPIPYEAEALSTRHPQHPTMLCILHLWLEVRQHLVSLHLVSTFHLWLKPCSHMPSFAFFRFISTNLTFAVYHLKELFHQILKISLVFLSKHSF